MKFIRSSPDSIYHCFNTKGTKHLIRLRLGLSHLLSHKLKHGFLDSLNPIYSSGLDIKTTCHYLLHCSSLINVRPLLLNNISRINKDKLPSCDTAVMKLLFYGDNSLDPVINTLILNASVAFILSGKRFDGPLLYDYYIRCK